MATAALLAGCDGDTRQQHREVFIALGQVFEVTLSNSDPQRAEQAFAALGDDLAYMDRTYLPQRAGALRRINQLLELQGWFSVNPSILPLIAEAQTLADASGGLFNPAAGRLNLLWGMQGDEPTAGAAPVPDAIADVLSARPDMADIEVSGIRVRCNNTAVQLDFGPFATGYALDRLNDRLTSLGVANATLATDSAMRTVQVEEAQRPWYTVAGATVPLGRVRLGASEAAFTWRRNGPDAPALVI
ncbi:MAG: FAD:protein FMN transferase, partial [Pseudomonadota bacterium]